MTDDKSDDGTGEDAPPRPPQASAPPAPEARRPDDTGQAQEDEARERREGQNIIYNTIYGDVQADQASFGVTGGGARSRRKAGPIDAAEVDEVLECYEEPASFQRALEILEQHHVVVLAEAPESGRYAGALALLRRVGAESSFELSWTLTLGEATDRIQDRAEHGREGYVLPDSKPEAADPELTQSDLRKLTRKLTATGTFLVITTVQRPGVYALRVLTVSWDPPEPEKLLEKCFSRFGASLEPDERAALTERAGILRSPREVVQLAKLVVAKGYEEALASLDADRQDAVSRWFDGCPDWTDVRAVAVAAFLDGLPLRLFERKLDILRQAFEQQFASDPVEHQDEDQNGDASEGVGRPLPGPAPENRRRIRGHVLLDVRRSAGLVPGSPVEQRLTFRDESFQARVFAEFWDRYDIPTFWDTLFDWLRPLAAPRDAELRIAIAHGLALLFRNAAAHVEDELLNPWSGGKVGEQLTVSYVLSWLCQDEAYAQEALRMAVGWAERGNSRRRTTAAIVLAGPVGLSSPKEARRWLWHLAQRDGLAGVAARDAFADLFAAAVVRQPTKAGGVAFLHRKIDLLARPGGSIRTLNRGLHIVVRVLAVRPAESPEPAVAAFLRANPDKADLIGRLWAEALRSRSHRGPAIDALRETLRALATDNEPESLLAPLGDAIAAALPPLEQRLIRRDLIYEFSDVPGIDPARTRALVNALVNAFDRTP